MPTLATITRAKGNRVAALADRLTTKLVKEEEASACWVVGCCMWPCESKLRCGMQYYCAQHSSSCACNCC